MKDEKLKENNLQKLNEEELENISGGVIVAIASGYGGTDYYLCDEKNYGRVLAPFPRNVDAAKKWAPDYGVSAEVITPEEYEKRFKHPFKL